MNNSIFTFSTAPNNETISKELDYQFYDISLTDWLKKTGKTEQTEILWGITAYNEPGESLLSSLAGIKQNLDYLVHAGQEAMAKQIKICLIFDGRQKMSSSIISLLASLDLCYLEEIEKDKELYIFQNHLKLEKISQLTNSISPGELRKNNWLRTYQAAQKYNPVLTEVEGLDSVPVIICIKEKNQGKLNSHWWLFQVLGRATKAKYCIQMDIGVCPTMKNVFHFWNSMETQPQMGGIVGTILLPNTFRLWHLMSLWQVGWFFYGCILERGVFQMFGQLDVFTGQFYLLRLSALNEINREIYEETQHTTPLEYYFEGLKTDILSILKSNMFLNEDKVITFAISTVLKKKWQFAFHPPSISITEECEMITELLKQRRRWINGAFTSNLLEVKPTLVYLFNPHGQWLNKIYLCAKLLLKQLETLYTWLTLSTLIILYHVIILRIQELLNDIPYISHIGVFLSISGFFLLMAYLFTCIANRFQRSLYFANIILFSIPLVALPITELVMGSYFGIIFYSVPIIVLAAVGFLYSPVLGLDILRQFSFSSLINFPTTTLLAIYAFCNINDCSWGTKGLQQKKRSLSFKIIFLSIWLCSNAALLLWYLWGNNTLGILLIGLIYFAFTLIFGTIFNLYWFVKSKLTEYRGVKIWRTLIKFSKFFSQDSK